MDDKDQQAKESARAPVNGSFMSQRSNSSSSRESAREATTRLDSRIATQRKYYNGKPAKDEKQKSESKIKAGQNMVKKAPPPASLSALENDTSRGGSTTDTAARVQLKSPPPYSVSAPSSSSGKEQLVDFESTIVSKSRASQTGTSGKTSTSASPPATASSGSPRALTQLEDDIVAKNKARFDRMEIELTRVEKDVIAKQEATAWNGSNSSVVARRRVPVTSTVPHSSLRDLDERIAEKTGVSRENGETRDVPNELLALENSVSKLSTPIALNSSLNKQMNPDEEDGREKEGQSGTRVADLDVEESDEERARLAVAVAVGDEDDDMYIPAAVQYDPEAKPPIYKNRRFRLYGLLTCGLLAVALAGAIAVFSQERDAVYGNSPTDAPTSPRETLGIQHQLEKVVGSEKLNDPSTPHFKAMDWIINDDPLQLSPTNVNLVQRFLLALFYFDTHQEGDWLSCNAKSEDDPDEFCNFKKLASVFPHVYLDVPWNRWLSSLHECMWAGIFCDEKMDVRAIDVLGQQISSTLPSELSYFRFIQSINLSWNNFRGTIPSVYGESKHLIHLELHYNLLTGELPTDWAMTKNLQLMNIAGNDISGTLSEDLTLLTNLKGWYAFENLLEGTFPKGLAQLSLLTFVRFNDNFISGTIPDSFYRSGVRELYLFYMPLNGTISTTVGEADTLLDFRCHGTQITGTIPEELYDIESLFRIDLFETKLSGTISTKIGQLNRLQVFRVSETNISGTLPTEIGLCTAISRVWLDGTNITGTIPNEMCDVREHELFEEIIADCLPVPTTGLPPVSCSCCDLCCDAVTGECLEQIA